MNEQPDLIMTPPIQVTIEMIMSGETKCLQELTDREISQLPKRVLAKLKDCTEDELPK